MTRHDEDAIPVIVGVGEVVDRHADPAAVREPAALMAAALGEAEADAGARLLADLDSLDIINEISWPYVDPIKAVAERAGLSPRRAVYLPIGGQTPISAIHEAALRIARGDTAIAAVCGAESQHAVARAAKANVTLPWSARDLNHMPKRAASAQQPVARALEVATPTHVYPFYENAAQHAWGQTPAEGLADSAATWARYSAVAATREAAWLRRACLADEIATVSADNRPIAWPYVKLMVANPLVNQGAAVLLTSLGRARRAGISPQQMIRVLGGAAARETDDYLQRDVFHSVCAMRAVLNAVGALLPAGRDRFDRHELYSCFPCVPKMARRVLGLDDGEALTVTGGLTFFGAPLNDYMTHAVVAMVATLRARRGEFGLLYGQGGYATKHHAIAVTGADDIAPRLDDGYDVQAAAEALRRPIPQVAQDHVGPATLETFTVLFDRDGRPRHGVVIARPDPARRLMARVSADDREGIARLMSLSANPIGASGRTAAGADGILNWSFT
ncbi:MAG: acetyl-CoA acetyltransferase [Xanthobacteraceae bacterium]|nr:acetyl-CoA acetyltransferase [Xanthobacteraceae bacterium]